jgi:hypothetical protein
MLAGITALSAVIVAAAVTLVVSALLSDPSGEHAAFSNFSQSLYGLVVGGKGWNQVLQDHPGATEGAQIYSLAWQAFRAHPMGIIEGSLKMWGAYLRPLGPYHVFGFVHDGTYRPWLQIVCYMLAAIGFWSALRNWREPPYTLGIAAALGHLASIPFVPPIDAGLRVYAATLPIVAIFVSVGAVELMRGVQHRARVPGQSARADGHGEPVSIDPGRGVALTGVAVAALLLLAPLVVLHAGRAPAVSASPCPEHETGVVVRLSRGSFLRITDDRTAFRGTGPRVPDIRRSDIRASANATELKNDSERFDAGQTMANVYDLETNRLVWLVAPTGGALSSAPGIFQVCGQDTLDTLSRAYGLFYGQAAARLGP